MKKGRFRNNLYIRSRRNKSGNFGHIYPELSEDQLEQIGMVDILVVPVGNSGYTLDASRRTKNY
jgi:hypothetical protein